MVTYLVWQDLEFVEAVAQWVGANAEVKDAVASWVGGRVVVEDM